MTTIKKLRITFICGCLEPGKDGVGDYSRRLAEQLTMQGHQVSLLSINDRLTNAVQTISQKSGEIELPCLRIPAILDKGSKTKIAKEWINKHNPEWLSLQYVSFSFQPKGLPFGFSKLLQELGKGKKWHIMFHELYVGMEREAPLKYYPWGFVQKSLIKKMINRLKPKVIHTQCDVYKKSLSNLIGEPIHHLPLFGNIVNMNSRESIENIKNHKKTIVFILFGWIHSGAPMEAFAEETARFANHQNVDIKLQLIGLSDGEKNNWIHAFENKGLQVENLGVLSSKEISKILANGTMGITTTPYALVDKSGTVAAMLEHDLPVVCVASPWTPIQIRNWEVFSAVIEYKKGNLEQCLNCNIDTSNKPSVSNISEIFSKALYAVES